MYLLYFKFLIAVIFVSLLGVTRSLGVNADFEVKSADANAVIQQLRNQMASVHTVRADYSITTSTKNSQPPYVNEVKYVRAGQRYKIALETHDPSLGLTRRQQSSFDGLRRQSLMHSGDPDSAYTGSIRRDIGQYYDYIQNDVLFLAGFSMADEKFSEMLNYATLSIQGVTKTDGVITYHIVLTSPYQQNVTASTHYWIEQLKDGTVRLRRNTAFISDDSNKILYDKKYTFPNENAGLLPISIEDNRYQIVDGRSVLAYQRQIVVKEVILNGSVSETDFQIDFPDGTLVSDSILGITYLEGEPRMLDRRIADFAKMIDGSTDMVSPANAPQDRLAPSATESFLQSLPQSAQADLPSVNRYRGFTILVSIIFVAGIVVWLYLKYIARRRKPI